jgi:hypothetical protein
LNQLKLRSGGVLRELLYAAQRINALTLTETEPEQGVRGVIELDQLERVIAYRTTV